MTITEIAGKIKTYEDGIKDRRVSTKSVMRLKVNLEILKDLLVSRLIVKYFEEEGTASDKDIIKNIRKEMINYD